MDLLSVKVGDQVKRMLAGIVPMWLTVTNIKDNVVHCGDYTFNAITGMEIDVDCGWDGVTHTGSHIAEVKRCG